MSSPEHQSYWTTARIALWSVLLLLTGAMFGPAFVGGFRPPDGFVSDFVQEWLSAKSYAEGGSVYAPQRELIQVHLGVAPDIADSALPWNAHPPVSVLVVLPFGGLGYQDAHFAWNLLNVPLLILALAVVIRELGWKFSGWSLLPTAVLTLSCYPLYYQVTQGNLNVLLLALVTFGWAADRRGNQSWAGVWVGAAAAMKLFPLFLFIYFAATRRWRALVVGCVTFAVLNLIALVLLGTGAYSTYINDVMPSVLDYQSRRQNASLTGFWLRIFNPHPAENIVALYESPALGSGLAFASRLIVTALVGWCAWRADSVNARDRAFALGVTGMLLVAPVAWPYYFVLLALPLALAWSRLETFVARRVFWLTFVVMWLPNYYFLMLFAGPNESVHDYLLATSTVTAGKNLALASIPNYALMVLFVLVLRTPVSRTASNGESSLEESDREGRKHLVTLPFSKWVGSGNP